MGQVISFEDRAVANLRARLGEAEGARDDLIAFAKGHSSAVGAIHEAVLSAVAAPDFESLLSVVARDWPSLLAIDSAVLALIVGNDGFAVCSERTIKVDRIIVDDAFQSHFPISMRSTGRGHPLFGKQAETIRAEALVTFDCGPGLPRGLLLLGQHDELALDSDHGACLLLFLARTLAAIMGRWVTTPTN